MIFRFDFGLTLLKYRKAHEFSQQEMANLLNVHKNTYMRWENGNCAPAIMLIPHICRKLGMSPNELFQYSEEE